MTTETEQVEQENDSDSMEAGLTPSVAGLAVHPTTMNEVAR